MDDPLERAVDVVVGRCLAVREGEDALVIADEASASLGEALRARAAQAGADATLALIEERATNGAEPPRPVAAALVSCDVYIAPTTKSLSHTKARKAATDAGARGATLPGVTAEMLARLMDLDYDLLARRCRALAAALTDGAEARLTCPRGSDLRLDLAGRDGIADDGDLTAPGAFGNLPCGEGFIAPAGGEGVLVATTVGADGICRPPARLTVRGGRLAEAGDASGERFLARLLEHGELGANLAELGIGANDRAGLTGNVLEDEKILGSAHVAFGASAAIGGTVSVPIHEDCVVLDASIEIDGRAVLDAGRLVIGR